VHEDGVGDVPAVAENAAAEDFELGGEVGGVDAEDHAGDEAAGELLAERVDLLGGAVAGEDDLFAEAFDLVEGVEELLLGGFFIAEEVDIVDDEEVGAAEAAAEEVGFVGFDGFEEFVGELLGGEVEPLFARPPPVKFGEALADALEEVGFAEAAVTVEEEGVELLAGVLGDLEGGVVGELVVGSDDEFVEGVLGVDDGLGGGGGRGGGGRGGVRGDLVRRNCRRER
jgi:hypothetical protein